MNGNQLGQRSPAVSYPFNQPPVAYHTNYNNTIFGIDNSMIVTVAIVNNDLDLVE